MAVTARMPTSIAENKITMTAMNEDSATRSGCTCKNKPQYSSDVVVKAPPLQSGLERPHGMAACENVAESISQK